jgi:ubiquinone/menaquinone biosynthesis C-methylase UbiE
MCSACDAWFRVEEGIVDLLPHSLRVEARYQSFANRHRIRYTPGAAVGDEAKLHQMEFFRDDVSRYEQQVVDSSFYQALDRVALQPWMNRRLRPGMRVLELGCGTGRQMMALGDRTAESIGLDISEEMLRVAQRKLDAAGRTRQVTLIAADAERPPLAEGMFDACLIYGTLHHLPNPGVAIVGAARCLRSGGSLFTRDPHKSPLRWVFDLMMRVWKLYEEEAREDPLLQETQLAEWFTAAGLSSHIRLSTYLPPHLLYLCTTRMSELLLSATDAVLSRVPGVRKIAGVIMAEGVKP